MSINKAQQGLPNELINRISDVERQLLELKTHPQPIGADVLKVVSSPVSYTGQTTVGAGGVLNANFMVTPVQPILTMMMPRFTVYIDGHDNAHMYPYGTSMTTGMIKCDFQWYIDWATSDDTAGIQIIATRMKNTDSVSHTFGFEFSTLLPIMPYTAT